MQLGLHVVELTACTRSRVDGVKLHAEFDTLGQNDGAQVCALSQSLNRFTAWMLPVDVEVVAALTQAQGIQVSAAIKNKSVELAARRLVIINELLCAMMLTETNALYKLWALTIFLRRPRS